MASAHILESLRLRRIAALSTVSSLVLAAFVAQPALAQTADPQAQTDTADQTETDAEGNEIVVTGFRASLQNAQLAVTVQNPPPPGITELVRLQTILIEASLLPLVRGLSSSIEHEKENAVRLEQALLWAEEASCR